MIVCAVLVGNNRGYNADVLITYTARALNVPTATELLNLFTHPDIVADVIISPSTFALKHESISSLQIQPLYPGQGERYPPRMLVVSPGVDVERFTVSEDFYDFAREHAAARQGSAVRPFVVGFTGRLSVEKNVGLFVLSAYEVVQWMRQQYGMSDVTAFIRFLVIGDGGLRSHLFDLCVMLDIVPYVQFTGWVSGDSYVDALGSVDVLVNPSIRSWSETFCIANIEAMAKGIPLVTFGIGGVGEYIDDADVRGYRADEAAAMTSPSPDLFRVVNNAVLMEEASPRAITAAVLHVYRHLSLRKHLGAAGRITIERSFTVDQQMRQYEEVYRDIHTKNRGKRLEL